MGRFYLNHRYSDDLDFFSNADPDFQDKVEQVYRKLQSTFSIDDGLSLFTPACARFYISASVNLKIELVNDVPYHWGKLNNSKGIRIDNPANILANKLGAVIGREEPKDVFDIVCLADNYSFNWRAVYQEAFKKQIINESDISMKICSFPALLLENQLWLRADVDQQNFTDKISIIADDIIYARDNTLGMGKTDLTKALLREQT